MCSPHGRAVPSYPYMAPVARILLLRKPAATRPPFISRDCTHVNNEPITPIST